MHKQFMGIELVMLDVQQNSVQLKSQVLEAGSFEILHTSIGTSAESTESGRGRALAGTKEGIGLPLAKKSI